MGKIKIWKFDTCHFDLTTKEFLPGTKEFQGGTRQLQSGTNGFQSGTRWWTPGFPILSEEDIVIAASVDEVLSPDTLTR